MMRYSIEPRTRKYVKGYGFLSFARKYKKQLLDKGQDASKKVVHKAGEFIGNKIADAVTKSNDNNIEKQKPLEEIIIPPEKREEILNKLGTLYYSIILYYKWNTILSKLLDDSTVSKL